MTVMGVDIIADNLVEYLDVQVVRAGFVSSILVHGTDDLQCMAVPLLGVRSHADELSIHRVVTLDDASTFFLLGKHVHHHRNSSCNLGCGEDVHLFSDKKIRIRFERF